MNLPGSKQSAFSGRSSQTGSQPAIVPLSTSSYPSLQRHSFGRTQSPKEQSTIVGSQNAIQTVEFHRTNPSRQLHTSGAEQIALSQDSSHTGVHPSSNSVRLYPARHSHTFGAVQTPLLQGCEHVGLQCLVLFPLEARA